MSVSIQCFRDGVLHPADLADVPELLSSIAGFLWVDILGPEPDDISLMLDTLKLHPLAVDDTRNLQQRPKVEDYGDHTFIILNPVDATDSAVNFRELDVFVSERLLVTVHNGAEPVVEDLVDRLSRPGGAGELTPGRVVHHLMDTIVDAYFPVLDGIIDAIEDLEDGFVADPKAGRLQEVYRIKRTLLDMQRVLSAQRDMFGVLTREDVSLFDDPTLRFYVRDVYDHVLRLGDQVTMAREMVSTLVELYLSATSNRLNEVVNRLTVITLLIGVVTVVTGFYGMNFTHLWPLEAEWGVPFALGVMLASGVGLLAGLRRLGWW